MKLTASEFFEGHAIKNEGYFLEYGNIISEQVNIPIITVGGLSDINNIEKILNETNIDYFAISRPLLAEPHLIKRWKEKDTTPAKCVRCSKCRTTNGNYCTIFNK